MKKVEKEIEIDATPEEVWRALTEGEELKRWFPLDARVTPGVGGVVWLSWGEGSEWEAPIEVWEPKKHLRTVDAPTKLAVDYFIESRGGKTILRLVHSGFGDDMWDDELDTLSSGWASFLANLRHYLEVHPGKARSIAFFRHAPVESPRPDVYRRTMKAMGMDSTDRLKVESRYATTSRNGDHFEGVVKVNAPPIHFTGTAENWGNGFLMIEIEPGRERCRPAIWCSLYGPATKEAGALQERLKRLMEEEFREGTV